MPSPFPGMDPYLEHPAWWPGVHNRLIVGLADALGPVLRPNYVVSVEERVYVGVPEDLFVLARPRTIVPDVSISGGPTKEHVTRGGAAVLPSPVEVAVPVPETIREAYLEVRSFRSEEEVVTVLEVLSPANKRQGAGRDAYLDKRDDLLTSRANLVEVDLLRGGDKMPVPGAEPSDYDYSILVCRAATRPTSHLFMFTLRDAIPVFKLPLRPGEEEPPVDLSVVVEEVYDRGSFDLRIDYRRPPEPPLPADDELWADGTLRLKGPR